MTTGSRSLRRNGAFLRLWAAGTVSVFGSLITRTALPFAAILVLGAGPLEIAVLRSLELVAAFVVGLVAGAWVDRLRRRPVMIVADVGRAVLLGSIPLAAVAGALGMGQLYAVAFLAAVLTTFFDLADRSYLPTVVDPDGLVAANGVLTASASVAEFSSFGIGGFLIQVFSAPIAIAVDAASFVVSAVLLGSIRRPEPARPAQADRRPIGQEIREGLGLVAGSPILRATAGASAAAHVLWGVFGTVYLLYGTRELGLGPAAIGVIAGLGGIGSLVGAVIAGPSLRRIGLGNTLLAGLIGFTVGSALLPLAPSGALVLATACLVAQQLVGDCAATAYDVVEVSLRQSIVADENLGRVNGTFRSTAVLFQLAATIAAGLIAEALGLRAALVVGLGGGIAAIAFVWFSPVRSMQSIPVAPGGALEIAPPLLLTEEMPLTE